MKRSELRETIEWVMQSNHPALDYKDVSEQILDAIEAAGMLPPIEPDRTVGDLDLGVPEWEQE